MSTEQDLINLRARVVELENRLDFLYKKLGIEFSDNPNFVDARIIEFLKKGNKLEAIKVYRELTNTGLAEAKNAVENIETRLGL
ncbi:MAG: ribosomal protein L7/L12 [Anaerolineales bacterium]|nr:ribosomal protein L7/L12 [Anaerolineales bacterium]